MKDHIVKNKETLGDLSSLYFGNNAQYYEIYKANPSLYQRFTSDISSSSVLYPGEVITIPVKENRNELKTVINSQTIQIQINNEIYTGWTGVTINLSLDEIADTFSFNVPFDPNEAQSDIFKRFVYQNVNIIYENENILSGIITKVRVESGEEAITYNLQGYSYPGVFKFVNWPPNNYPRKWENLSLRQICQILADPFGIGVEISEKADEKANISYNKLEIGITQKIGDFMIELARDRSLILSNTIYGDLLIDEITKGALESLNILKPTTPDRKNTAVFDGDKIFKDLFVVSSGDELNDPQTSIFNFPIKPHRPIVIENNTVGGQNLQTKAENLAKKSLADGQKIESSIPSWLNNNNELLRPGQIVVVKDPSIQIFEDERHIIKTVELTGAPGSTIQAQFSCTLEAAVIAV